MEKHVFHPARKILCAMLHACVGMMNWSKVPLQRNRGNPCVMAVILS